MADRVRSVSHFIGRSADSKARKTTDPTREKSYDVVDLASSDRASAADSTFDPTDVLTDSLVQGPETS